MPYVLKSFFLTVSFIVLMLGIADSQMFFLSVLIFAGSVAFDLYFAYKAINKMTKDSFVVLVKIIIIGLTLFLVIGIVVSLLGLSEIIYVTDLDEIKYIVIKNDALKSIIKSSVQWKIKVWSFLKLLAIQIVSCLPDYLIHKKEAKIQN